MNIKFRKHFIQSGEIKAKVRYSFNNHISGKPCVTVYAKDYVRALSKIFASAQNDTDISTDYFDKDRVHFFEGDEHYAEILRLAS
jgi:hypothetical protein